MDSIISTNQVIINSLMLNASFIDNIGLLNGKMGIAICFFQLARTTNESVYYDYAGELIDEIYDELSIETTLDFENGLAGIGWGIEYLVQNGFLEADTNEVLEEFDNRLYNELNLNPSQEIGLLKGIIGLGIYFLTRIPTKISLSEKKVSIASEALIQIIEMLDYRVKDISNMIYEESTYSMAQNKSKFFDITWDYSSLLWFCSELLQKDIASIDVENIIERLIEPLDENRSKLTNPKRLLISITLLKLKEALKNRERNQSRSGCKILNIEKLNKIVQEFLAEEASENVKSPYPINNASFRYGTSGIAFIHRQIQLIKGDYHFKNDQHFLEQGINNFDFENPNAFGLMEGLAGIILIHQL
ncbi:lanthionine synthetase LanC family protein [Draconibacterium sp. IB214405]|uniref:lanthionine synthetase LanC family protein n=1 Tax=Draconibacterium sp. IB214405 TaxID=3097352 RepID=UPI002A0C019F|nr:lanthionine synthetase LanC family protein [Draconibacterium sp. IB214405]MDX8337542.1 lanthionine synthetase LanC family protein [Draconibacterium sp. IB214405]